MSSKYFRYTSEISRPAGEVFRWHERPGVLERLTPPWEQVEVLKEAEGLQPGQRAEIRQKIGPLRFSWEVEHQEYNENREFRDVALRGPFSAWEHVHRFVAEGANRCTLSDEIEYRLPGGPLGSLVAGAWTEKKLRRLFAFRHQRTAADLKAASRYGAVRPMQFLVSGASGLIGRALIPFLRSQGHEVVRLVRRKPSGAGEIFWDPMRGELDLHRLKSVDAVIHLAGANIASRRWSRSVREDILNSRVQGTRTLVAALEKMRHRPFVFLSASAVGFYGDRGGETLDESSGRGQGFLAEVCDAWEQEAEAVETLGIRCAMIRTGMVLSPAGGALARLLPVFRAGLGGRLGSGRQWVSWIGVDDLIGAYYHALLDQRCTRAVNAVAPHAVTNAEFSSTLARVLHRPAAIPAPAPVLKLALGEMADELLLGSTRVLPRALEQAGYRFRHERLEDALRFLLGAPKSG